MSILVSHLKTFGSLQVIYPERAEIMGDTVAGILKLSDMFGMMPVSVLFSLSFDASQVNGM